MFGTGGGWGIPVSNHTLQITLGGIATRSALINGQLENRQMLCVTISFDHDIVDGAPAARFIPRNLSKDVMALRSKRNEQS